MSDFPEFDKAFQTVLIKDPTDKFEQLAAQANFNVYHSDIWRGTGRKFAELIVRECSQFIEDKFDFCGDELIIAEQILKHFGIEQ